MAHPKDETGAAGARRVVYTALMGNYERLNEQPVAAASDVDFVCFTDDPEATSDSWTIRLVEPRLPLDTVRSARYFKMHGPELLAEYAESLWIDNSVLLRVDPARILDEWLTKADMALPLHSYRASVLGEFDAVATKGYDDPSRVYEQMIHYSTIHPEVLREQPYWTAILARRHTPEVVSAMRLWQDHVMRYSRRDQLSANFILRSTGLEVAAIELDNWNSEFHQWPQITERRWDVTQDRLATALRIPVAELGRVENEMKIEVDKFRDLAQSERDRANAYSASSSWAITRPIRAIGALFRRA